MNPILTALAVTAVGALLWGLVYCLFHYSAQIDDDPIEPPVPGAGELACFGAAEVAEHV